MDHVTVQSQAKSPAEQAGPTFSIQRQIQMIAGAMVLVGGTLTLTVSIWWVLLCLWVGLGLTFAGLTGICPMEFILLKMPWNKIKLSQKDCVTNDGGCSGASSKTTGGCGA
ncbi:MAG: DUF2892 domain-containing protein [Planctomycetia bacterium]